MIEIQDFLTYYVQDAKLYRIMQRLKRRYKINERIGRKYKHFFKISYEKNKSITT